jgi:hypothetical protein
MKSRRMKRYGPLDTGRTRDRVNPCTREKSTPEENESSEAKTPEARTVKVNHGRRSERDMH